MRTQAELTEARIECERAADWRLMVAVGCEQFDAGHLEESLETFLCAVSHGETWASINVGNTYWALDRLRDAEEWYLRAIDLGDTDAIFNLALVRERLGYSADDVRKLLVRAAQGGDISATIELAFLLREQGDERAGMELLDSVAQESDLATGIAACWRWDATGDLALEPALRRGASAYESARVDLAELLVRTGRGTEATALLEIGVALNELQSFVPLANLREEAGDWREAARLLAIASELGDAHGTHNLALLIQEHGPAHPSARKSP